MPADDILLDTEERMEKAIRYEKLLGLVTSGRADVADLKKRIKQHDAAITKATKVEEAAAFLAAFVAEPGNERRNVFRLEGVGDVLW